jgi:anti-sigma factor RsiW
LDPEEERRLRAHVAVCEDCAAELRTWQELAGELAALPVPQAPPALVARTREQVAAREEAVLFWMAALGWSVSLAGWAAWVAVFGFGGTWVYLAASTTLAWLTAGAAAVIAHAGGKHEPL